MSYHKDITYGPKALQTAVDESRYSTDVLHVSRIIKVEPIGNDNFEMILLRKLVKYRHITYNTAYTAVSAKILDYVNLYGTAKVLDTGDKTLDEFLDDILKTI